VLPAGSRLRRRQDFAVALRRGPGSVRVARRTLVASLTVVPDPPADRSSALAGFVVSRAVGPAVVRNRVRRRLRHLVRDRLPELPASGRLVVRALPPAAEATSSELRADLDDALARAIARVTGSTR
jgi:ribonuclease P protein component